MKNLLKNQKGFTMVELMIVVIIVGILAAAAVPLYRGNVKRAIRTEAMATLGSIRAAERVYKAEYGGYVNVSADADEFSRILNTEVAEPRYFSVECYTVTGASATAFTATVTNDADNAAPGVAAVTRHWASDATVATMNAEGTVTEP